MDKDKQLPECKFGAECYRKNSEHLLEFWHPPRIKEIVAPATEPLVSLLNDTTRPRVHMVKSTKDLVLLMLIGPPGSGKSTFCQKVLHNPSRPWTRVCQDVISNGNRGTRVQCLKTASTALSAGHSVLIDRCNIDIDQRKEFLQLAKERGIEAHALVLNLPVTVCIQRASQRTGHEGGLDGPNVGAVVNRVSRTRTPPTLGEGFVRITYCRTDAEVEKTVILYSQLHPKDHLPEGVFGASVEGGKGTLQSLFQNTGKDVQVKTANKQPELHMNGSSQSSHASTSPSSQSYMMSSLNVENESTVEGVERMMLVSQDPVEDLGARSLAFPSISTADFQFDHDMAATIMVEAAATFHKSNEHLGLRLVFVDLSAHSDMLARVRRKAAEVGIDSLQLLTHSGDITKLRTSGGPWCNFIANATNWRLKPGGGGVNAAIFKAAGASFEEATQECAKTLSPGGAVAVPLPIASPLRRDEGVTHVIHVLGPNMNPQRPNCLAGDYKQGCQILRATYNRLFETFSSIAQKDKVCARNVNLPSVGTGMRKINSNGTSSVIGGDSGTGNVPKPVPTDALAMMMQAAKRKGTGALDPKTKRERMAVEDSKTRKSESSKEPTMMVVNSNRVIVRNSANPVSGHESASVKSEDGLKRNGDPRPSQQWGSWAQALRNYALHPEQHSSTVVQVTDEAVVCLDKYAKGKKHLLVVARRDGLDSIDDVRAEHLPLLKHLHSLGEAWARSYLEEDAMLVFRLGYHLVPSMRQLHMHVISQDFDSPNLKNKKHWNSFTTGFFRDSQDILAEVEERGRIRPCSSEAEGKYLGMELRCHRCRSAQPNLPRLKAHLLSCKSTLQCPYLLTSSKTAPL